MTRHEFFEELRRLTEPLPGMASLVRKFTDSDRACVCLASNLAEDAANMPEPELLEIGKRYEDLIVRLLEHAKRRASEIDGGRADELCQEIEYCVIMIASINAGPVLSW